MLEFIMMVILLSQISAYCYAETETFSLQKVKTEAFDPLKANKILDKLSFRLSTEELVISNLEEAVKTLISLQADAELCVKGGEAELAETTKALAGISGDTEKTKTLIEEQKYLRDKKTRLTDRVSNCRLFLLRSQEAIDAFTSKIQERVTTKLFKPTPPIWEDFIKYPRPVRILFEQFDKNKFIEHSGLSYINSLVVFLSILFLSISFLFGFVLRKFLVFLLEDHVAENFTEKVKYSFYNVVKRYSIILISLSVLSVFFGVVTFHADRTLIILNVLYGLLGYYIFISVVRFIFYPGRRMPSFTGIPEDMARKSYHRLDILGILGLMGYFGYVFFSVQDYPIELMRLFRSLFIIFMALSFLNIIWIINRFPKIHYKLRAVRLFASIFIGLSLGIVILAELLGYHELSTHVLWGDILTVSLTALVWFATIMLSIFFDSLNEVKKPWQEKMRHYLTFGKRHAMPEIFLLRFVVLLFVWLVYVGLLILYWTASESQYIMFSDALLDGFTIANVEIIPSRIVIGIILFSILSLATRLTRSFFRRKVKMVDDPGAQEALATIIGYIGFALAVIFAMLVAGVNFTGIAIVAGALSVGIGFGLQNIVSNFVSGIILLIERPIKIGDRIFVAGEEGKVKKISIRSTRVRTQNNSDLIVPNSEIVANTVTNFMFGDRFFRIDVNIGVAYGSDVNLVRNVLFEIVQKHEDIVNEIEHLKPRVLFWEHGDSALIFQLRCNITDVNKRYNVQSDLNFAINKAFKEHHIEIPFPQTDIHVKELPGH